MLQQIATLLSTKTGWPIRTGTVPAGGATIIAGALTEAEPDAAVYLLESSPSTTNSLDTDGVEYQLQVITRHADFMSARTLGHVVVSTLVPLYSEILPRIDAEDETEQQWIVNYSEGQLPMFLTEDDNGRFLFSTNLIFRAQYYYTET